MGKVTYLEYHKRSMEAKDVDPSVICLKYLADRFELNLSQRYWIAFLYGTNYCATTTFLMYNEFPDFELVDVKRLNKWWNEKKDKLIFQSDRLRVKTGNNFVPAFISYKRLVKNNQQKYFSQAKTSEEIYKLITNIKFFGRFSCFNYLDVLNQITDVNVSPKHLNMLEAESCRKGLCYALNQKEWAEGKLNKKRALILHEEFVKLTKMNIGNVYQIETTLCAYKKYIYGKRYIGFYIERMKKEIEKMEKLNYGVAWETLWQFRKETFEKKFLTEIK
tara:strand:+ start:2408 stop:3235 length:828 start_codon:yes stop_codon:yes gene_type:complete